MPLTMTPAISDENIIQVAIEDPYAIVRQALNKAFLYHGKIRVIAEASCYSELLEMLSICKTKIIILEVSVPNLDSTIDTISQIQQIIPDAKILILTSHNDDHIKRELIELGIYSFIYKGSDFELLVENIIMAANSLTKKVYGTYEHANNEKKSREDLNNIIFSEREKTILKLIVKGKTNIEISKIIFLSVSSIEQIRHNMKLKAKAANTANLIDFAIRNRMIE